MENLDRPKEIKNNFQASQVKKQQSPYRSYKTNIALRSSVLAPNPLANNLREIPLQKSHSGQNTLSDSPVFGEKNQIPSQPNESPIHKTSEFLASLNNWDPYRLHAIGQIRRPKNSIYFSEKSAQLTNRNHNTENQHKNISASTVVPSSANNNRAQTTQINKKPVSGSLQIKHDNPLKTNIHEFSKLKLGTQAKSTAILMPNHNPRESTTLQRKLSSLNEPNTLINLITHPQSNIEKVPKITGKPLNLADPGKWACIFIAAALEVINGVRPLSSLVRWAAPEVTEALAKRRFLISHNRQQQKQLSNLFRIHKQRIFEPTDGVAEVSVSVEINNHVRACALRLEIFKNRWLVTALELG